MVDDLFHKPVVLYQASAERKEAAWSAFACGDYVLAMYLAGLAVECILQTIALHDNPTHDAKHDLPKWLARCRTRFQDAIKAEPVQGHWNRIARTWRNELRYLSRDGLLGYLRKKKLDRGLSGGPDAIMKKNAKLLLDAAEAVFRIGVIEWHRCVKKSSTH